MTAAGFTKNGDGLWEKDGADRQLHRSTASKASTRDIVPVLVEMLKTGGFDANVNFGTDAYQNMADGKPGLYMFGHGASTVDPYRGARPVQQPLQRSRSAPPRAATTSRATRTPNTTKSSTRWPRSARMIPSSPELAVQAMEYLLERHDRYPDHPVAAPHPLQPDLLDQLADRGQPGPWLQRRLLGPYRHAGPHQPEGCILN